MRWGSEGLREYWYKTIETRLPYIEGWPLLSCPCLPILHSLMTACRLPPAAADEHSLLYQYEYDRKRALLQSLRVVPPDLQQGQCVPDALIILGASVWASTVLVQYGTLNLPGCHPQNPQKTFEASKVQDGIIEGFDWFRDLIFLQSDRNPLILRSMHIIKSEYSALVIPKRRNCS